MILVLLGSHEFQFSRLLNELEKLVNENIIKEEVIVQSGCTEIVSKKMKIIPFMQSAELDLLYEKANLIITHGGTASIIKGVQKRKKVIAVARLKKYNEVIDDHQLQIINEFEKSGYLIHWKDNEPYSNIMQKLSTFEPKIYQSNSEQIIKFIDDYISEL